MNPSIAITLGHNSSAVLISPEGEIIAGYETERFDLIKSSSRFPAEPIKRLLLEYGVDYDEVDAFVGHWFTSGHLPSESTKHCDLDVLKKFNSVNSLSQDLTHHDTHLESAMVFAGREFFQDDTVVFVMDGFGTMGECISIYNVYSRGYSLIHRVFGYNNSLGMLYQYATDFMGMKMNNHEYKILAYEVHINEISCNKSHLEVAAINYAADMLKQIFSGKIVKDEDPVVNVSALQETKFRIHKFLHDTLDEAGVDMSQEINKRIATAYVVQMIVETVVMEFRRLYPSKNLLLSGGLFYNVKLNNMLADTCNQFCVMPVAGDQGAGLGVYNAYRGDLKWPGHVFWGLRDLYDVPPSDGIIRCNTMEEATYLIDMELRRIGFVNIVRGAMEFGPRALCNTTTLAYPDLDVTALINEVNDRTAEMPMAPVVTRDQARAIFKDVDKVHKSLEYMIMTRDYADPSMVDMMLGAAHYYPDRGVHTGRPQITDDLDLVGLLNTFGPLVNTSFNFHGMPIVFERDSIQHTHNQQRLRRPDLDIKTIIVRR